MEFIDGACFRERKVFWGDGSKKFTFYEASVNITTPFPCAEVLREYVWCGRLHSKSSVSVFLNICPKLQITPPCLHPSSIWHPKV